MQYQYTLDTCGLLCPEPVMLLHARIDDMAAGETVLVTATDPSTQRDIPRFCQFLGHALLREEHTEVTFSYLIQKSF